MTPTLVHVQMFGDFSLRTTVSIANSNSRSKKIWLLLAYILLNRNRSISAEEMIDLLWGKESITSNPLNALKTILHRLRTMLAPLTDGLELPVLLYQNSAYVWNPEVSVSLDVERFDALCAAADQSASETEQLQMWMEALSLYQGSFLSRLSSELWVIPIAAHYHNLYIETALKALPILEAQQRWQECADVCRNATSQEPYMEDLYAHWMQALIHMQQQRMAITIYENMSELFLSELGVIPSDSLCSLYRLALRDIQDHAIPSGLILERLREAPDNGGALVCDYDIFRSIYQSIARTITRSGDPAHLALISVLPRSKSELSRNTLDRIINQLQALIRYALRRGDMVSRCSGSQFVMLLLHANYDNSCMVCNRLVRLFNRKYPHSPAKLQFSVHPVEPNDFGDSRNDREKGTKKQS